MYDYNCKVCSQPFQNRKPNKIYCSRKCFYSSIAETWRVERPCTNCGENYIPSHKKQEYCGHKCHGKILGEAKKNSVKLTCNRCSKEFERRASAVSKENYCSWECRKAPTTKICEACKKEYSVESNHWKASRFCSKSCAKSGENHHFYGKHPQRPDGFEPWTKGKTVETDPKIAELGRKISEVQKEQFKKGIRSNKGANNPNYGKTTDMRTPTQLNNYSKGAAQRVLNGQVGGYKFLKTGFHQSPKASKPIWYRSSYELRAMICFDKDSNVIHYESEPFAILYDNAKRYIPDFFVFYRDGRNELIECKGSHLLKKDMIKIEAGKKYCQENSLLYRLFELADIEEYEAKLEIAFEKKEDARP